MSFSLAETEHVVLAAVSVPLIYFAAIGIGRLIKKRIHFRLGVRFHLLSLSLALLLPLLIFDFHPQRGMFDLRRELSALAIFFGTLFVLGLVRHFLWDVYFFKKRQTEIPQLLQEVFALLVIALAIVFILNFVYDLNIPGLLAGSGIVAVILGLAMQDLLGNVFSGIAIQTAKPFKIGDWLLIDNFQAEVMEVNWRSTRLRTNDHVYLDIPNSHIVKNTIVNYTYPTRMHAMRLRIGVDYNVPPNVVKDALRRAAHNAPGVLETPPTKIFLVDFADFAVIYEVKFWIENHSLINEIYDSIRTDIWYEFSRRRIKIPFPIRTLRIERPHATHNRGVAPKTRSSLREQTIFQVLNDAQFDRMLSLGTMLRFGRGEPILRQGDEGNSMFILLDGTAEVSIERDGIRTKVGALKSGDCFGEMSLLTGERRSAWIAAKTDCEVLEVGKEIFHDLLHETPALAEKLSDLLARRRLENEGALAANASTSAVAAIKEEYKNSFFKRLASIFDL